ncbi:MAG: hypothetical protein J6V48_11155 [Clostridia bacterium]|jgi:hypothetical protein|nr:hypothetical protein [Clostridia bacterium]MBO7361676.1 hypothetical protein [Clostridia bacterium]MCR4682423.1 hypothetical protein [Clostridiales bacterium]
MIWRRIHRSTKEQEEKFEKDIEEVGLEKGDRAAMFWAAFLTLFLPASLILIAFVLLVMLIFGLFW